MDDASKLGLLWVSQLNKEVATRRNRAAESLMTVKPEGDYAKQHRMLIDTANAMLAAPALLAALRKIARVNPGGVADERAAVGDWSHFREPESVQIARAALAAAGAA